MADPAPPLPSPLFRSPIPLAPPDRQALADALQARLMDGVDLYASAKVAHWNTRGPAFAPVHALFDAVAGLAAATNDRIAERIAALGALTQATVTLAAARSTLPRMPIDVSRDLALVRLIAERLDLYLRGLALAATLAEQLADPGTVNLLGDVIEQVQKQAWMVTAHLDPGGL